MHGARSAVTLLGILGCSDPEGLKPDHEKRTSENCRVLRLRVNRNEISDRPETAKRAPEREHEELVVPVSAKDPNRSVRRAELQDLVSHLDDSLQWGPFPASRESRQRELVISRAVGTGDHKPYR